VIQEFIMVHKDDVPPLTRVELPDKPVSCSPRNLAGGDYE
jgi:hypothetical protein